MSNPRDPWLDGPCQLIIDVNTVLGTVTPEPHTRDAFTLEGEFEPTPEFEPIRSLFLGAPEKNTDTNELRLGRTAARSELRKRKLRLENSATGASHVPDYLYVEGNRIRWRANSK